jgi:hypothetical protein
MMRERQHFLAALRSLLGKSARLALRGLARLIITLRRFECLRIGNATFFGPEPFLRTCADAVRRLQGLDPVIFDFFTNRGFVFWYEQERLVDIDTYFSVNESYCRWGPAGIMAFIVFAVNKTECWTGRVYPQITRVEIRTANLLAFEKTRTWLAENSFPQELVRCFTVGAQGG